MKMSLIWTIVYVKEFDYYGRRCKSVGIEGTNGERIDKNKHLNKIYLSVDI